MEFESTLFLLNKFLTLLITDIVKSVAIFAAITWNFIQNHADFFSNHARYSRNIINYMSQIFLSDQGSNKLTHSYICY